MSEFQPDQIAARWNAHVAGYEEAFEPFTLGFAEAALAAAPVAPGQVVLDLGCGPGGFALRLAPLVAEVHGVDFAPAMIDRLRRRAAAAGRRNVFAHCMDGAALGLADAGFDRVFSIFGVILLPEADRGFREMRRVLKPHGQAAIVTWTAPERYELMRVLLQAINTVIPDFPPPPRPPAQLRFQDATVLEAVLKAAGFTGVEIGRVTVDWPVPGADWLEARLAFAPGMAALLRGLGPERERAVREVFRCELGDRFADGPFTLAGDALVAVARP